MASDWSIFFMLFSVGYAVVYVSALAYLLSSKSPRKRARRLAIIAFAVMLASQVISQFLFPILLRFAGMADVQGVIIIRSLISFVLSAFALVLLIKAALCEETAPSGFRDEDAGRVPQMTRDNPYGN
ncbi:MAG: hypothetical protein R3C49_18150 [Planctomycetaceae bacterium]